MRRIHWEILLTLIAGFSLGLAYSWGLAPLRYVDTTPDTLRADFKEHFRVAIAAAYVANGSLDRAEARLNLLGDPDPIQALSAQAQQMLAAGESFESVRQVAELAADLQAPGSVPIQVTSTFEPTHSASPTPTNEDTTGTAPVPGRTETIIPDQVIEPPQVINTPTARPTRTTTPALGAPFQLTTQDTLCEANATEGLLQIILTDSRRRQLPGLEIVVTWTGGEDHFYTGLKPELGDGYADTILQPGVVYSVRVAEGGTPISNISAPECPGADGSPFTGGLRLTFQR
jgi:hypothetical protein